MPQPGAIYWSDTAQQFYQEGRSGALSRLEGISSLTSKTTPTGVEFYDQQGNLTPNPLELLPQSETTRYVNTAREATIIPNVTAYESVPQNSGYGTVFVYRDAEGKVHAGLEQFRIGSKIDSEVERSRILARIGHETGINEDSPEGGSDNLSKMLIAMGHYRIQ